MELTELTLMNSLLMVLSLLCLPFILLLMYWVFSIGILFVILLIHYIPLTIKVVFSLLWYNSGIRKLGERNEK